MSSLEDRLCETDEESKFGYELGQEVMIIKEGPFFGQIQEVVGFTKVAVIVTVSGPRWESDSEWWFSPEQIQKIQRPGHCENE